METLPGGLAITLACDSSGFEISGDTSRVGNNVFDYFKTAFESGPPATVYARVDKNTAFTHNSLKATSRYDYDISSALAVRYRTGERFPRAAMASSATAFRNAAGPKYELVGRHLLPRSSDGP